MPPLPVLINNPTARRFVLRLVIIGAALSLFNQLDQLAIDEAGQRYEDQLLAEAEHRLASVPVPVDVVPPAPKSKTAAVSAAEVEQ